MTNWKRPIYLVVKRCGIFDTSNGEEAVIIRHIKLSKKAANDVCNRQDGEEVVKQFALPE